MANEKVEEKVLAEYGLDVHGMKVQIRITQSTDFVPFYAVTFPGIGMATKLLLNSLRSELTTMVPLDISLVSRQDYVEKVNERYREASMLLIDKYLPGTNDQTKSMLTAYITNMMLLLGDIEAPLADENLEEVAINGSRNPAWVFHKEFGWCKTNVKADNDEAIYEQSAFIGRRVGKQISNLAPLMDAELPDGSRVNATLFPISQVGNTITIRKFSKNPWTMPMMINNGTISAEVGGLVWLCIQSEISLLMAGGTASGKTSFLNAAGIFFQANRRIITVEETKELALPAFLQWIPMITRQPNPEGKGGVTLYDLMINALRQRPDIMLIGEVRTGKDAETLFEAIHTGHAVYGTIHADNAQDTIIRMTNPPISIPKIMMNGIGGVIVNFRHRLRGIRRVLEVAEVVRTGDANVLYKWNSRDDTFSKISELTNLVDTLSLYTGMTRKEIEGDITQKANILSWMSKNNIFDVDDAGLVVANYYRDSSKIVKMVEDDVKFSKDLLK
jgi:flagellar protein FlaI